MLKQKLALSYLSKIFIQVFQVGVTIVVARVAGASVLGTVAFATSFVSLFLVIFDMGQGVAHVKLVSEGQDESKCNGIFFRIQLVLSVLFFIIALGIFFFSKFILHNTFESAVHEKVILITIFTISIGNLFSIPRTSFNAKVEQAKADVPDLLRQVLYQILRLIVVILGYRAIAIAWSNLAATIIIVPFYIYLFRGVRWAKWDQSLFKKYIAIAMPVFITNIVDIFTANSDKVLLQFFYGSAEVGYYVAGFSIGGLITMVGNSAGLVLLPTFSKDISNNDFDNVSRLLEKFERFTWFFIFPVTLITSIGSDVIVNTILGIKYAKTVPVLSIINFSAFFITYFMIYGVILSGKGFFKLHAKIYFFKLVFLIAVALLFLHPKLLGLGSKGLALSILLSNLFVGLLFMYFVKLFIKEIKIFPARKIILFSIVFTLFAFLFYRIALNNIFKIIYLCSIPFIFWGSTWVLKLSGKEDMLVLFNILNPKKMSEYIKNEIRSN
jgi:O-antigen/teichoic acid export membrane protein